MKKDFFIFREAPEDNYENALEQNEEENENMNDSDEENNNDEESMNNSDNENIEDNTSETGEEDNSSSAMMDNTEQDNEKKKKEKKTELQKRINLFNLFNSLSDLVSKFLNSIKELKNENIYNKRNLATSDYILKELYDCETKLDLILTDLINKLPVQALNVLFSSLSTKIELLINLYKKLNEQIS